jgi:hypothetical protein
MTLDYHLLKTGYPPLHPASLYPASTVTRPRMLLQRTCLAKIRLQESRSTGHITTESKKKSTLLHTQRQEGIEHRKAKRTELRYRPLHALYGDDLHESRCVSQSESLRPALFFRRFPSALTADRTCDRRSQALFDDANRTFSPRWLCRW